MTHSDDRGLALPPSIAPYQVVIVPILRGDTEPVLNQVAALEQELKSLGIRVKSDVRDGMSPGWKFNEYEMRGVPIRIELGPKDLEKEQFVLARRDTGEKEFLPLADLATIIPATLAEIQENMLLKAQNFMEERTFAADTIEELKNKLMAVRGFYVSWWCDDIECLEQVQIETSATARVIPFEQREGKGKCICCQKDSTTTIILARAY